MDSTAIVAVVSVLVSGVLAPLLAARVAAGGETRQRTRRRFDELQALVDTASEQMIRGWWGYSNVEFAWRRRMRPDDAKAREAVARFEREWEETRVVSARLAIRLGREHQVCRTFRELGDFYASLRDVVDDFESGTPIDGHEERLTRVMAEFKERQGNFVESAHLLIMARDPVSHAVGETSR